MLKLVDFSPKSKAIGLPFCFKLAHIHNEKILLGSFKRVENRRFSPNSKAIGLLFCFKLTHICNWKMLLWYIKKR